MNEIPTAGNQIEVALRASGIELAQVLEKHAISMIDDVQVLLGPKNVTVETSNLGKLNYNVRVEPVCSNARRASVNEHL